MPIVDTLLRLAETQTFYIPKWSSHILAELSRTLLRFGFSKRQADRRIRTMAEAFPEALVHGYEELIPAMRNDPKDKHVLAAGVKCGARWIVSDNRRHFPAAALVPHKLECVTADAFLSLHLRSDPAMFTDILVQQAADIDWPIEKLLERHVPSLARLGRQRSGICDNRPL